MYRGFQSQETDRVHTASSGACDIDALCLHVGSKKSETVRDTTLLILASFQISCLLLSHRPLHSSSAVLSPMPAPIHTAKSTLSYPLYCADFDPYNNSFLLVGGGGGEGRSGVGNKIVLTKIFFRRFCTDEAYALRLF